MVPTLPARLPVGGLRIDGIAHEPGALTVLQRDERLPGGLRYSLDIDQALIIEHFARKLRTGAIWPFVEMQLFPVLRRILRGGARASFCIATIDSVTVRTTMVRFHGCCAPLAFDAAGHGGLTARV